MVITKPEDLASVIKEFVSQTGVCLFAGAGVGQKAGLPSWYGYLDHLATVASNFEEETAALMRKRVTAGLYLGAAELYIKCPEIPKGEKFRELAAPFQSYSADQLQSLMTLPFSSVVTTNYDRAIHDSFFNLVKNQKESGLSLKAPRYVELGEVSMRQAPYWTDFFIARIHGQAEIPETIILTDEDYAKLLITPDYQEFLVHILKSYRCLFIGFSFIDPAIDKILKLMNRTLPQPYPKLHLALIPADSDAKLSSTLSHFNIKAVKYDPANGHEVLWEATKLVQREIRTNERISPDKIESTSGLHRFLSSCFARMKLGKKTEPLREIVVQGIIAQTIADSGPEGINKSDLIQDLKQYLNLADDQLETLLTESLKSLTEQSICQQKFGMLTCDLKKHQSLDKVIMSLVDGVLHRLRVRQGIKSKESLKEPLSLILNRIFLTRGWDLGAHFAGGNPFSTFDDRLQVQSLLEKYCKDISPDKFRSVANAILSLFRYPDDKESSLLVDVGRIAFGVELVLNNARSTIEQTLILPDIIYLDASILLPSIVDGHPYGPIYRDAVHRMQSVGENAGSGVAARTASIFLEEILHHRSSSINEVKDQYLENPKNLRNHITLCGAQSTNVFIGSYASWVGRTNKKISYKKFLENAAPYNTEIKLENYLDTIGINTINIEFQSDDEEAQYNKIRNELHMAYDRIDSYSSYTRRKANVLIDHEAKQLAQLKFDVGNGLRPLFVTADKRLMSSLSGETLGPFSKNLVSHLGLIQLIDLVLGLGENSDKRSLARLMWSVEYSDEETFILNYLIDLALQYVDDAKTMAMWEVVDEIGKQAVGEAKEEGITMHRLGTSTDRARVAKFLDRFEQDFFRKMDEVISSKEE